MTALEAFQFIHKNTQFLHEQRQLDFDHFTASLKSKESLPDSNEQVDSESILKSLSKKQKGDYKHALYKIWHRAYMDKKDFNQGRLLLSQKDVLSLFLSKHKTPEAAFFVVPQHPNEPLSHHNAVLVDKIQRRYLLALWRMTKDEDEYKYSVDDMIAKY
jgi:hypothetical protein